MPVDNQAIVDKMTELQVRVDVNRNERNALHVVLEELHNIIEEEDPLSTETPKSKKPIIDRGTGQVINVARRQAIFDAQIIKADALLP